MRQIVEPPVAESEKEKRRHHGGDCQSEPERPPSLHDDAFVHDPNACASGSVNMN
jgi:hypothetical protein